MYFPMKEDQDELMDHSDNKLGGLGALTGIRIRLLAWNTRDGNHLNPLSESLEHGAVPQYLRLYTV